MNRTKELFEQIESHIYLTETTNSIYFVPTKQWFYDHVGINVGQCEFYLKYTDRIARKIKEAFESIELLLDHLMHLHADNKKRGLKEQQTLDKVILTLTNDYGWFK
jgi:CRISPR/Cas system CSM-associated protein Csm2 small subunit